MAKPVPHTPQFGVGTTVQYSSWERAQKNKPQSNSIAGGGVLLCASAIHQAWGIWRPFLPDGSYFGLIIVLHLAAILGVWIGGAVLVNRFSKRIIYCGCAIPIIVGNILFIACHSEYAAILVARLLIGLAHGILYVALVCHASENATNEMRGRLVTSIGLLSAISGVAIGVCNIYISQPYSINNNMLVGIMSLVLTVVALLVGFFLHYESVVFLMQKGENQEALEIMIKLRSESSANAAIQNDYEELNNYVNEEAGASRNIFRHGNARPLMLVGLVQVITFITNNVYINMAMVVFLTGLLGGGTHFVAPIILTGARLLIALFPAFLADRFGRKSFIIFPGYFGGLVLLVTGILVLLLNLIDNTWLIAGFVLSQACFGFGLDIIPHVVASEAFPLSKKSLSIAFTSTIEHLLHIGAFGLFWGVASRTDAYYLILIIAPVLVLVLTGASHWWLPETRMMSLSQCRNEYVGAGHGGTTYSRENVNHAEQGITYTAN